MRSRPCAIAGVADELRQRERADTESGISEEVPACDLLHGLVGLNTHLTP